MIGDLDYQQAQAALKAYAQTDTSGFAPSVGQLRAKVVELTTAAEMFEGEAWALVRRAIGRSAYYSSEEFAKLPKSSTISSSRNISLESLMVAFPDLLDDLSSISSCWTISWNTYSNR